MKRSRSLRIVGAAVGVLAIALMAAPGVSASNMAFKFNAQVFPIGSGAQGKNLVSLPDVNPYLGSGGLTALCTALGLQTGVGQLIQFDADLGNINTYTCGQVETFTLASGLGVMIQDTVAAGGVVVGSDIPGNSFDLYQLGASPIGLNLYPVEYHATATDPEMVCNQCGLSGTATVTRFDANAGNVLAHTCGQIPVWTLVLGESVLIQEPAGDVSCTPSHF